MKFRNSCPNLSDQPVLVIEIPRELVNDKTTLKYFNQAGSILELDQMISPRRWQYIGQFLLIHTKEEQVGHLTLPKGV